ncbi:MAG TPA: prepilin-type N-terminal cleavage/methylation domain-containing protein [Vicinamibacteria bacterium]
MNRNDAKQPSGTAARGERGFTLVETLVAIVVLVFGIMAVTNLMLVAASSNTVANQGTAAVTSATRIMDMVKATSHADLRGLAPGGPDWATNDGAGSCSDPNLLVSDWHCDDDLPGVGRVHTHWWVAATADPRLLYVRVRSEGTGVLAASRSRAEFTTFRACTNSDPVAGGCPEAP